MTKSVGKNQFLTYYIIAAHPGCTLADMQELSKFIKRELKTNIEQVQIFTPVPSTWAALMYYTGRDPSTGEPIFVEKDIRLKEAQKEVIVQKTGSLRCSSICPAPMPSDTGRPDSHRGVSPQGIGTHRSAGRAGGKTLP